MIKKYFGSLNPVFYDYLTVFFFGIIIFMGALGETGLRNDDVNYASISKTLLSSDSIMTLSNHGEVYLSKPPLFFWLTAVSLKVFGSTVFGAKFVSALCAVLLMLVIFKIAKDAYGHVNAGYGSVLFFASNYTVYKVSHGVRLESLLTLTFTAGILFAGLYLKNKKPVYLYISAVMCGLAVLTKGYLGVMTFLVILIFVFSAKEISGRLKASVTAVVIFLAVFSWWYAYAFLNTDFFNTFIVDESVNRLNTDETPWAKAPLYKYSVSLFKFSFFLIPFIYFALKRHRELFVKDRTLLVLSVLTAVYFVIIHLLSTKYARYLYPVSLYVSIAAGIGLATMLKNSLRGFVLGISVFTACIFAVYPGTFGDEGFKALTKLEKTAAINGGMLCPAPDFMEKWENRSGIFFFTDSYRQGECGKNDIIIQKKKTVCDGGMTIVKNIRITACTKQ